MTIHDDDEAGLVLSEGSLGPSEGGSESYTVALATQPSASVTVTITGHSGTDLTLGETSLMFTTTNWATGQSVTVTAGHDDDTVDDEEVLTHTASGGGYGSVSEDLPVTVDDDDEAGLVLSEGSLGPSEGGSESYTVALATQPSASVTVTITGHSGTDLTLDETSLTFTTTNWATGQSVRVTAGHDDDTVDDEEVLTHTASGGGYGSVSEDLPVTVDDDDADTDPVVIDGAGLVLSTASLGLSEGASTSYTVKLSTQPSASVTVTITGHSGTDLTLDETSLTFTTTNWATGQSVTVTAGQDADAVDDTATLEHSASGGGYGSVTEDLPVTIHDDDEAGLVPPQIGGIFAYFTVAYGDNRSAGWGDTILGECHSREATFRAIWGEPRQESPADEWEVSANLQYGASDLSIEVRYGYGRSDLPELIGSVEINGYSRVQLRVRGRYGQTWSEWSPMVVLRCFPSES